MSSEDKETMNLLCVANSYVEIRDIIVDESADIELEKKIRNALIF